MELLEREDVFLVAFKSDAGVSEYIQCRWVFLWDGDAGRFFEFTFVFGHWSSGEDNGCKSELVIGVD